MTDVSLGDEAPTKPGQLIEAAPPFLDARPHPARVLREARFMIDVLLLVLSASATVMITRSPSLPEALWQVVFIAATLARLHARGAYVMRRVDLFEGIRDVVASTVVAGMLVLTAQVVIGSSLEVGAVERGWGLALAFLVVGRIAIRLAVAAAGAESGSPTLIVGAGKVGNVVAQRLLAQPHFGLRPVGFLDKEPLVDPDGTLPLLGASWDLERVVREHDIRHVVIAFSTAPTRVMLEMTRRCEALGVSVAFVPRLFESVNGRLTLEHLGGIPLLRADPADPRGWAFACKYALDRVLAAMLIVFLAPALLLLSLSVRFLVGSPVLFRQVRIGRDGRCFEMLKFRSMRGEAQPADVGGEAAEVAPGGVEGADRRTPLGALLRQTTLDELPQLFNVLKGEMSLVGPRPERPAFVDVFVQNVYRYGDRHRVKSGMTGWAQIHGLRGKTSLSDRVEWDNYYIENWSLWLDVKILLLTATAVLRSRKVVE
jgi:exopolysaccharide biosynthesis polyprenyl glycosylphosphotransferase